MNDNTWIDSPDTKDLLAFARYLAWANSSEHVMMSKDDIEGELMVELVKGMRRYADLPDEQRKAVIRRMMDNRIGELKYKFYMTHRSAEQHLVDLDDAFDVKAPEDRDPASVAAAHDNMQQVFDRLSPLARKVLTAILGGNERLGMIMQVAALRSSTAGTSAVNLKPRHLADALLVSEQQVLKSYKEIRLAMAEQGGSNG